MQIIRAYRWKVGSKIGVHCVSTKTLKPSRAGTWSRDFSANSVILTFVRTALWHTIFFCQKEGLQTFGKIGLNTSSWICLCIWFRIQISWKAVKRTMTKMSKSALWDFGFPPTHVKMINVYVKQTVRLRFWTKESTSLLWPFVFSSLSSF
jgi:hypothetical protein